MLTGLTKQENDLAQLILSELKEKGRLSYAGLTVMHHHAPANCEAVLQKLYDDGLIDSDRDIDGQLQCNSVLEIMH